MNVFYLDDDPVIAATWLCDQHVSKMILESAQMMCTAIRVHMSLEDTPREELPDELKFLYKTAHPKHGSTKWVGECFSNFQWLFMHVIQMHAQHKQRFGTRHKSFRVAKDAWLFLHKERKEHNFILPESMTTTPPYMAFGPALEHLKNPMDPAGSYRRFYIADKAKFATWTNSEPPPWWPKEKC